jgi:hypothetical protein
VVVIDIRMMQATDWMTMMMAVMMARMLMM